MASKKLREFESDSAPYDLNLPSHFYHLARIPTGSQVLDKLLGGGIEVGALTEFFGASASGKTQLCHTISVISQVSPKLQYPSKNMGRRKLGRVIYVDTEGSFRSQRIEQIARARGLRTVSEVVNNIILLSC